MICGVNGKTLTAPIRYPGNFCLCRLWFPLSSDSCISDDATYMNALLMWASVMKTQSTIRHFDCILRCRTGFKIFSLQTKITFWSSFALSTAPLTIFGCCIQPTSFYSFYKLENDVKCQPTINSRKKNFFLWWWRAKHERLAFSSKCQIKFPSRYNVMSL